MSRGARPGVPPLRARARYGLGLPLPGDYRAWVAADLTGAGWRHRAARRTAATFLPFAVVFALLPGSAVVRISLAVFLAAAGVAMGYALASTTRDRRLAQHGLPPVPRAEEDDGR